MMGGLDRPGVDTIGGFRIPDGYVSGTRETGTTGGRTTLFWEEFSQNPGLLILSE